MSDNECSEGKSTWKERRKKQLYDELIKTAERLFGDKEIDETSVDEIVTETGIAKGTFYLYFESKSEIIRAVIDAGLNALEERTARSIAKAPDQAPDALCSIAREIVSFFLERPAMVTLLISRKGISGNQIPTGSGHELKKRYNAATIGVYERIIRKGMLQGHFREIDAHTCASAIACMLSGLICDALDTGKSSVNTAEEALNMFIRGIARRG